MNRLFTANQGGISWATRRYHVFVREPVPCNLRERLSALHAHALLRREYKVAVTTVGQTCDDCKVVQGGNNADNA